MRESVNVTVLRSNDWLCFVFMHFFFFYKIFMHFTCLLLLAAGEMVGQCTCTDLFASSFFLLFFIELFFTL